MKRGFGSDNHSGISPEVLQAIAATNTEHAIAYGEDETTTKLNTKFKEVFGSQAEALLVFNGTGANVLSLKLCTEPFHAIICANTAHINVDECGAPERFTGCKLITIETPNGKLTPELIKPHLHGFGFQHHSQPKVISITQPTELGTLYQPYEITALSQLARQYDMYLHLDGARLSNAAVQLNCSLKSLTTDLGVDILSFGGTKNGLMIGEAVVVLNKKLLQNAAYHRKQAMQLSSKMRFISIQLLTFLKDNLWRKNASHANKMAQLLHEKLQNIEDINIIYPVESNAVFAQIPRFLIEKLQEKYFFYEWEESKNIVRWMCSFDTTEQDIIDFTEEIKKILQEQNTEIK